MLYELAAFLLAGDPVAGIRNGADVLLKSLFLTLGGHHGLLVFNAILLGAGAVLVGRDLRRNGQGSSWGWPRNRRPAGWSSGWWPVP